jgi:hypothetical protein
VQEVLRLLGMSVDLFIDAATAVRYIGATGEYYGEHLTEITNIEFTPESQLDTRVIDSLYNHIIDRETYTRGKARRKGALATVVCLQIWVSASALASLLSRAPHHIQDALSPFHSVIHVPSTNDGHVSIFHASLRDLILDPARCGERDGVDVSDTHQKHTIKCLESLKKSLWRYICNLPEGMTSTLAHEIPIPSLASFRRCSDTHACIGRLIL